MTEYKVQLDKFSGPLQLLLELIEHEKLPITEVSLARVTEDYLNFLNKNHVPTEDLADFLTIASKLILLKSKAILPELAEEEDEGVDLSVQLKFYSRFVEAAKTIEKMYASRQTAFVREKQFIPTDREIKFTASAQLTMQALLDSYARAMKRLELFFTLGKATMERVVSIQEKIKNIQQTIAKRGNLLFSELLIGGRAKVEVVLSFMALLELVKQKIVNVSQNEVFGEIQIKHVE